MTKHSSHHKTMRSGLHAHWPTIAAVVFAVSFVALSIFSSGTTAPFSSSETYFTDPSSQGLQIVPASGGSTIAAPTITGYTCYDDNTVTVSWSAVTGATEYRPRYRNSYIGCPAGWFSANAYECDLNGYPHTSINFPIVYDLFYDFWVHAYDGTESTPASVTFACYTPVPSCTLAVDPSTVNQPASATLSWTSTQADSFYISNVSYVTPNTPGSTSVAPSVTTVYDGTVVNTSQSYVNGSPQYVNVTRYCDATLTVNRSCTFDGSTVTHGNSVTAYQAATVPYGSSCVSQSRTCTDGTLSGSYAYGSCSTLAGPDFQISVTDLALGASRQLASGAQPTTIRKRIDATLLSGAPALVSFTASGVPAGVTVDFSPASCTLSCSSTSTIIVGSSAPPGNHTITITGTAPGPTVRSSTFNLHVACQPTWSCQDPQTRVHTNAACEVTVYDEEDSCVSPFYCSAGSSVCLVDPPEFIPTTSGGITYTGHLQIFPEIVASGATAKLYWNVENVSSCTVTENNPTIFDSFTGASSSAGGTPTSPITQSTTYTLQCTPDDGSPFEPETRTVLIAPVFRER